MDCVILNVFPTIKNGTRQVKRVALVHMWASQKSRIAAVHMCCIDEGFKAGFGFVIVVWEIGYHNAQQKNIAADWKIERSLWKVWMEKTLETGTCSRPHSTSRGPKALKFRHIGGGIEHTCCNSLGVPWDGDKMLSPCLNLHFFACNCICICFGL